MTTQYMARIDENPDSDDYMKLQSLHRIITDDKGVHFHRWDGENWVDNNNLIRHVGIGGDEDYQKISEAQAEKFKKLI